MYLVLGLVQERCNSIANSLELCLSCTNPSKCTYTMTMVNGSGGPVWSEWIPTKSFQCTPVLGFVQERCNSIANALELRLSCTNPSKCTFTMTMVNGSDGPVWSEWIPTKSFQCTPVLGLVQERCNSIANALELRLSCTNPSKCTFTMTMVNGSDGPVGSEWIPTKSFQCTPVLGLVQERCNSIANALELRLSCTNPSKCTFTMTMVRWTGVIRMNST